MGYIDLKLLHPVALYKLHIFFISIFFFHFVSAQHVNDSISSVEKIIENYYQKTNKHYRLFMVDESNRKLTQMKTFRQIQSFLNAKIYENQSEGYIKSHYNLDSTSVHGDSLFLFYTIVLDKKFRIDSIQIYTDDTRLRLDFIKRIVMLDVLSSRRMEYKKIVERINAISFIEMARPPEISFHDTNVILNLFVRERKNNSLNAILGLLPNSNQNNELQLTGDVQLQLSNVLNRWILLNINWQKNLINSQFLYLKMNVPFLFQTPFGVQYDFSLEKFDTNFIRSSNFLALEYRLNAYQSFSLIYKNQSSAIDGIDFNAIIVNKKVGMYDYVFHQFGVGSKYNTLMNSMFNKRGWYCDWNVLLGTKTIEKNAKILSLKDQNGNTYDKIYDTIALSQQVFSYQFELLKFTSLTRGFILKNRIESKGIFSDELHTNEMFNFGGIKMPRGFNDNDFVSSHYVNFTSEWQYYLTETFYSDIFVDMTMMKNYQKNEFQFPIGLGVGFAFKSGTSIFQMNIGSGQLETQNFSITNSKVHLLYVNTF